MYWQLSDSQWCGVHLHVGSLIQTREVTVIVGDFECDQRFFLGLVSCLYLSTRSGVEEHFVEIAHGV